MKHLLLSVILFCSSAAAAANQQVTQIIQQMSDEQKAAQLILVYYTTPEFVLKHEFGGVLIMQNMLKDASKLKAGLKKMQAKSKIDLLVSIDQEGGKVNRMKRLPNWKNTPSAQTMSNWSNKRITQHASKMAVDLKELGINLNLAPVLDPSLDHTGEKAFMHKNKRSFGTGIEQIVPKAGAYIKGFTSQGIGSISKHFPGYDVQTNSDHDVAVSKASLKSVYKNIQPFEQLANQATGVMISSIHYQQFSDAPAVMSKQMVSLARESHPNGILMTDDLWGEALRSWVKAKGNKSTNKQVLALTKGALEAGNDMLMITYPEKAVLMIKAISKWMKADENMRKRVNDSVFQILINKQNLGLLATKKLATKEIH